MADIDDIKVPKDTFTFTLKHPETGEDLTNDDNTPMTVEIYGTDSKRGKAIVHKMNVERFSEMAEGKTPKEDSLEDKYDKDVIGHYANFIKDWNITWGGKKPKFTTAKAKELFSTRPAFLTQLITALYTRENFLPE